LSLSSPHSPFHSPPPPPTPISTLSLHDAHPISRALYAARCYDVGRHALHRRIQHLRVDDTHRLHMEAFGERPPGVVVRRHRVVRSEEHTSELQSHLNLVCRLLLEKKKKKKKTVK